MGTQQATDSMSAAITKAANDISRDGYARVILDPAQRAVLAQALNVAEEFFAKPVDEKLRHENLESNSNYGYRPIGVEYSATPDRVDLNDSFNMWSDRLDLIPGSESIPELTAALLGWRDLSLDFAAGILAELAHRYDAPKAPAVSAASNVQVNSYFDSTNERDLLQDKHEDGHLLTVIHGTAPGLEIFIKDEASSGMTDENEVIIMPGSLLTRISGGDIPPLYHQVRNLNLDHRMSIMYFVNPELTEPVMTWKDAPGQEQEDLREMARLNPLPFGLKPLDVL
jgi:isopenicillin N synthase-like dioxygenase